MADLQERFRHWEERQGLVAVGHLPMRDADRAVARSLDTMHQARRVFEIVRERLGAGGFLDPCGGDAILLLHARDRQRPDWLVPKPLLRLAFVPTSFVIGGFKVADPVLPADAPEGWKPGDPPYWDADRPPDIVPRGPGMCAGSVTVAEGPSFIEIVYDERGVRREASSSGADPFLVARYAHERPYTIDPLARPPTPRPLGLLCRRDLRPGGHTPDELASMILELDPWSYAPGRVRMPVALPGGAVDAWTRGLWGLREALWDGRVAADARVVVADAFEGRAAVAGSDLDDAMTRWDAELFRTKPKAPEPPSPPPPPPKDEEAARTIEDGEGRTIGFSTGTIHVRGPASPPDLKWPAPTPRNVPACMVPLPPRPRAVPEPLAAAEFSRWMPLVGGLGAISHALVRDEPDGFTMIGEGVLDLIDPATLDAEMDAADAKERAFFEAIPELESPWVTRKYPCRVVSYRSTSTTAGADGRQRTPLGGTPTWYPTGAGLVSTNRMRNRNTGMLEGSRRDRV